MRSSDLRRILVRKALYFPSVVMRTEADADLLLLQQSCPLAAQGLEKGMLRISTALTRIF